MDRAAAEIVRNGLRACMHDVAARAMVALCLASPAAIVACGGEDPSSAPQEHPNAAARVEGDDGGVDPLPPQGNLPVGYYARQCQWDACDGPPGRPAPNFDPSPGQPSPANPGDGTR
jgi:hypothetical protein